LIGNLLLFGSQFLNKLFIQHIAFMQKTVFFGN
jgi:hypothetical protein